MPALPQAAGAVRVRRNSADRQQISLLILQHPQEQDRELGTARLTALHFKDALLKIGLSWPSLTKILGRSTDPQRWAILYLGSVKAERSCRS